MRKLLDYGEVSLVDMMGDDIRVLQAARVSTGSEVTKGEDQDKKLIDYLMKNKHHTPFEKIVFEFYIKCPIFIARQWMRHRIGSYNEASARYKEFKFEAYIPEQFRKQSKTNHQGSEIGDFDHDELRSIIADTYDEILDAYEELLLSGVAREIARLVLPMGIYTEFYWTVNFRSLMNFLNLRDHEHAQWEIQQYAKEIKKIITEQNHFPLSWDAYLKYNT